jgi:5-methylcytosine-specific restriction enzyme B
MGETITGNDCRTFARCREPGVGAWAAMPEVDKAAYLRVHDRLGQIMSGVLGGDGLARTLDGRLTLGFNPTGGVRGTRPKDLWCAVFPRDAEAYMPQVYLIVSHRGAELGFAAAIHPTDFTSPEFRAKVRQLAPIIFDRLPAPAAPAARSLADKLAAVGGWHYRRKTRMEPNGDDFSDLADLLAFLKSPDGKAWGAGTVTRYWLPEELDGTVDLGAEFATALRLFRPLLEAARLADDPAKEPVGATGDPTDEPEDGATIRDALEGFLALYPETRAGKSFGVDRELWAVLDGLRRMLLATPALQARPHVRVDWSVGQGGWARVPWVAFLDHRLTTTTQRGVYGALLFREDMTGVYLTYNQGVTEPKKEHGTASGLQLLRENARALRDGCPELAGRGFRLDDGIDLRTEAGRGRDY